jgi:hypothetical protein
MKKNLILSVLLISIAVMMSCKTEGGNKALDTKINAGENKEEGIVSENKSEPVSSLTPLPKEVYDLVYNQVDQMDGIFDELTFSMSQETNSSIQQLLNHVDMKAPMKVSDDCPRFSNQLYKKEGEVILEADVYCSEGCFYYIFKYQGEKYYNKMLQQGINFYENLKGQNFGS